MFNVHCTVGFHSIADFHLWLHLITTKYLAVLFPFFFLSQQRLYGFRDDCATFFFLPFQLAPIVHGRPASTVATCKVPEEGEVGFEVATKQDVSMALIGLLCGTP